MPAISVWLLRIAFAALLAGTLLGGWLLGAEPWGSQWLTRIRGAHVHLMLFGWLVPFVLGVAYWMLPRHGTGEERGPVGRGVAAGLLIVAGVLSGVVGSLADSGTVVRLGSLGEILGIALFLSLLWPRVKKFGREVEEPGTKA